MMALFLASLGVMLLGGLGALLASERPKLANILGAGGAFIGAVLGLPAAVFAALGGPPASIQLDWALPGACFDLALDPLSGFFLIPTLFVSALAAVYGTGYLESYRHSKRLGWMWLCFDLLMLSMALVMSARNGVLFLAAWEGMALSSFFLVCSDHEAENVRQAGWVYLVASHLGTACILALFTLLAGASGSFDFSAWPSVLHIRALPPALFFLLALLGFGTKAGFWPLHVWLPEAHPEAPSHVSAVMSGVMIKAGVYGLVRMLALWGAPPAWWGWLLLCVGLASGILGVLFALAQHDLKKLLAYHSVENIGIIAIGLGLGLVGLSHGSMLLAVLGFGGGLLHVLNHALFKSLLFLGAGAVLHATGTRDLDELGGLMKRMPWTGAAFMVGAAAISGLPPFNGFVSEFLLYCGGFADAAAGPGLPTLAAGMAAIGGLGLIGGLAAACFAKASGIVFLGEPRSPHATHGHEAPWSMTLPMVVLALSCIAIGLFPGPVVRSMAAVVSCASGLPLGEVLIPMEHAGVSLNMLAAAAWALVAGVVLLAGLRSWLLSGRLVDAGPTWDCGYAHPTPRMQYSASSFAQPFTELFSGVLFTRLRLDGPKGYFPAGGRLATSTGEVLRDTFFDPVFSWTGRQLGRMRFIQVGRVQVYVLYLVLTLLALLIWLTGGKP
ncbi:MAG: proton-conducting transporter membrane subunit [Elusimicrobiota bacterium]